MKIRNSPAKKEKNRSPTSPGQRLLVRYLLQRGRINAGVRAFLFARCHLVLSHPSVVHFELTNHCNLKCLMCERAHVWKSRGRGMMDFELFKKGVDEASEMGISRIQVNRFGESTLHPQIDRFIHYAKEAGIPEISLISNATMLDEDFSRRLINSGLDEIQFSFDGARKETYESIRQGAKFEETKQNIERFLEIRCELGKTKPLVVLNTILMRETEGEIEGVKKEWRSKVDMINVQDFKKYGEVPDLISTKRQRLQEGRVVCMEPSYMLVVFWNGQVSVCCRDSFGDLIVGDLTKASLREIWHSQRMGEIRKKLRDKDFEGLEICARCDMTRLRVSPVRRLLGF